jgi:quercetin dioxygenase-like cupin family protein
MEVLMQKQKSSYIYQDDILWQKHPFLSTVKIKRFISSKDKLGITYFLATVAKGKKIDIHIHDNSDDYLFILEGKGEMFIEDTGVIDLYPGVFVRVPKGFKHGIGEVYEDLLYLDIFHPEAF